MNGFVLFDLNEELMLLISEVQKDFSTLNPIWPIDHLNTYSSFESKLSKLQQRALVLFDRILTAYNQERQRSGFLFNQLKNYKQRLRKYLTMHKELSTHHEKILNRNKSLTSSMKKVNKFMQLGVASLESSLKKHKKNKKRLFFECDKRLKQIETDFSELFSDPVKYKEELFDASKEFDELFLDLPSYQEDYSRISMEKNMGGWESEFESDVDEQGCGTVGRSGGLVGIQCLGDVREGMDNSAIIENVELIRQLLGIQAKRNSIEDILPENSVIVHESGMCQTMVSLGRSSVDEYSE